MTSRDRKTTTVDVVELDDSETGKVAAGDAALDNFVGFYQVTDTNGGLDADSSTKSQEFANAAFRLGHT